MSNPTKSDQLDLLMQYTTFHIGIIIAIITVLVTMATFLEYSQSFTLHPRLLLVSIILFLLSGIAAGVIASSIPQFEHYATFKEQKIGFSNCYLFAYPVWSIIENYCFWLGMATWLGPIFYGLTQLYDSKVTFAVISA